MYPAGYAPQAFQRSGIPKVVGILAIVFSAIGALGSAIWTFGPLSDIYRWHVADELSSMVIWMYLWAVFSLALFALHLVGGIMALQYKPIGLRLLGIYASSALVLIVVDAILDFALVPGQIEGHHFADVKFSVTVMRLVFCGMAAPWPIIVLALTNSRRAKEACGMA